MVCVFHFLSLECLPIRLALVCLVCDRVFGYLVYESVFVVFVVVVGFGRVWVGVVGFVVVVLGFGWVVIGFPVIGLRMVQVRLVLVLVVLIALVIVVLVLRVLVVV